MTFTSFEGESGVTYFQVCTLKSALKMYRDTGMKANRAYTPSAMMATAAKLTGKTFKARDYTAAIEALEAKRDELLAAKQKEVDHQVDFQYHRIGRD